MSSPPPVDRHYGTYRRRVRIVGAAGRCSVDVEDDHHRFGADIEHDGHTVLTVHGRALRTPWTTCAFAVGQLDALVGTPLLASPYAVLRQVKLAQHCTHLIDMAALAIAAAARNVMYRQYDATLEVELSAGARWSAGTIGRSDGEMTRWAFRDDFVAEPAAYAGQEMRRAASWIGDHDVDADAVEMVFVAQRALLVSNGRRIELDGVQNASEQPFMMGACFTFQPGRAERAVRNGGSSRTFASADALLRDLEPRQDKFAGDVERIGNSDSVVSYERRAEHLGEESI